MPGAQDINMGMDEGQSLAAMAGGMVPSVPQSSGFGFAAAMAPSGGFAPRPAGGFFGASEMNFPPPALQPQQQTHVPGMMGMGAASQLSGGMQPPQPLNFGPLPPAPAGGQALTSVLTEFGFKERPSELYGKEEDHALFARTFDRSAKLPEVLPPKSVCNVKSA